MVLEDSHVQRAGSLETAVSGERDIVPEDRAVGRHLAADGPEVSGSGRNDRDQGLAASGRDGRHGTASVGALSGQEGAGGVGVAPPGLDGSGGGTEAEEKKRG